MFKNRKNEIKKCEDKISDLKIKKTECIKRKQVFEERIKCIDKEISNISDKKFNLGFQIYSDKELRDNILQDAEKCGYSHKKISELRDIHGDWNLDCIGIDEVDSFLTLDEYVKNNRKPFERSVLYKISKFFSSQKEEIK